MEETKYLISAYQKKALDLFNLSIANEAKQQQFLELIEAYKAKVDELVTANKELSEQIEILNVHVNEREEQLNNLSKATPAKKSTGTRSRKKLESSDQENVRDGGSF